MLAQHRALAYAQQIQNLVFLMGKRHKIIIDRDQIAVQINHHIANIKFGR